MKKELKLMSTSDGTLQYNGENICNFQFRKLTKSKIWDEEGKYKDLLFNATIYLTDAQQEMNMSFRLRDIETPKVLKNNFENVRVWGKDVTAIVKALNKYVYDNAEFSDSEENFTTTMGLYQFRGKFYYVGYDGSISDNGFTTKLKSIEPEALRLSGLLEMGHNERKKCIQKVNELLEFSFEDRFLWCAANMGAILDPLMHIIYPNEQHDNMSVVVVGRRHSGKTSLSRGWGSAFTNFPSIPCNMTKLKNEWDKGYKDRLVFIDDLATEERSKPKTVDNFTAMVQSYFDRKRAGSQGITVQAKIIFTTEMLVGRASTIERCVILKLNDYVKKEKAIEHLTNLRNSQKDLQCAYAQWIQWILMKMNRNELENSLDYCLGEGREKITFNAEEIRQGQQIKFIYAANKLWSEFCKWKGINTYLNAVDNQNWINYLKDQYMNMIISSSSREECLVELFNEYFRENIKDIHLVYSKNALQFRFAAIDLEKRQIGVYIPDVVDALMGGGRGKSVCAKPVMLLLVDELEKGINQLYEQKGGIFITAFSASEIKKILARKGICYTKPRSGKDGTNYTFQWVARTKDATDKEDVEWDTERARENPYLGLVSVSSYAEIRSCIAINMNLITADIQDEIIENNKHIEDWRRGPFKDSMFKDKMENTLTQLQSIMKNRSDE